MATALGTLRQRQAQATREQILAAGQALFLRTGFGATTIEAIAREAGVGVSTVYAVFESKRGILRAIRERWWQESGEREILREAEAEDDLPTRLEMAAHATRRQWESGAALSAIEDGAAAVDAEVAAERANGLANRRRELAPFVRGLTPHLRPGLDSETALAIFLALTRAELYRELVEAHGWTSELYEAWLGATLCQQLLA